MNIKYLLFTNYNNLHELYLRNIHYLEGDAHQDNEQK